MNKNKKFILEKEFSNTLIKKFMEFSDDLIEKLNARKIECKKN